MWRSLVAYLHGVQVVAGSNPVIPTKKSQRESVGFFVFGQRQIYLSVGRKQKSIHSHLAVWLFLSNTPTLDHASAIQNGVHKALLVKIPHIIKQTPGPTAYYPKLILKYLSGLIASSRKIYDLGLFLPGFTILARPKIIS